MSMRAASGLLVPALIALGCAGQASPEAAAPARPASVEPKGPLDGWVHRFVAALGAGDPAQAFHGEVLIARGDEVVVHRAYRGEPDRRFRVGSVTKPITAVAVLQLAARGELDLDDSIRAHVPELPEAYEAVTLAHLLSHRGGVASYTNDRELMERRGEAHTHAQMLEVITRQPLIAAPGARWSYSNSGYYLLGLVIERVSGKPWATYLAEHVFAPAGMTRTDASVDDLAPGLTVDEGAIVPANAAHASVPFAAGAIASTARDLHRFALALRDDTLLPVEWRERMWTDRGGPTDALGWGYGWMLRWREEVPTVGHNGGIDGFTSAFELTRDGAWIMVALSNLDAVNAADAGEPALRMALTRAAIDPPKPAVFLSFDPELGRALAGAYALSAEVESRLRQELGDAVVDSIRTAIFSADGSYRFKPVGQSPLELRLRADGRLVNEQARVEITVEDEGDGGTRRLLLRQGGLTLTYERARSTE